MKAYLRTDAMTLRRRGYSFAQLSDRLGISKSTASLWTRDVEMSPLGIERINKLKSNSQRLASKLSHNRKLDRLDTAEKEAEERFLESSKANYGMPLFASLFECEGSKDEKSVRFTNSDPNLVRAFLSELRRNFKIDEDKIKIRIHIHDYHDENQLKEFWSSVTHIPHGQFYKSFKKPSDHKYKKDGYMGCVHISYYDAHIARVIRMFAKKMLGLYS